MPERSPWQFYVRWSSRELVSGHFGLIFLAIILIVASVFSLFAVSERMSQVIDKQGKDALLADVVFESANPPPEILLTADDREEINASILTRFTTMLFSQDAMKLVMVKAVQSNYPLRGDLQLSDAKKQYHHVTPGTVWLDKRLMDELSLYVGDSVAIGDFDATVSGEITAEPGINFNPFRQRLTVYIHQQDLAKTGAIQPGSRVKYRVFLAAPTAAIMSLKSQVKLDTGDRWLDADDESRVSRIFEKTRQYISIIVVIIVLMASATLAVTSQSYAASRMSVISALRCMGARKRWIIQWILIQLSLLFCIAVAIGLILGIGLEFVLRIPLQSLLPAELLSLTYEPYLTAVLSCLMVLIPSVGIPVRQLWQSRKEKDQWKNRAVALAFSMIPLAGLLFIFRNNTVIWLMLAGIMVLFVILAIISLGFVYLARKSMTRPAAKLALMRMSHTKKVTGLQLGTLGLSLMLISVIWMIKGDLFSDWRSVLPESAPNIFAFNISTADKDDYLDEVKTFAEHISPVYPILRGRIAKINDQDAIEYAGGINSSNALRREINFTWGKSLPTYNEVVEGGWSDSFGVSVESGVAQELKLKVGDTLTFVANSIPFEARVNSIRNVDWRSMKPNFFFIFTPDVMKDFSASWLLSYQVSPKNTPQLNHLSRQFPTVSIIDLRTLTEKIQSLLNKVIWAISLLSGIAVLAGFLLIVTILLLSIDVRRDEIRIYRTLGASQTRIRNTLYYEFGLMGLIASVVAYIGAELLVQQVTQQILGIHSAMHWSMLVIMPVIVVLTLLALVARSANSLVKKFYQQTN